MEIEMIKDINSIVKSQFLAAMHSLYEAIYACKDTDWNRDRYDDPFSQIAFHTLFNTDLYLERGPDQFKEQQFHIENKSFFQNYEELNDRPSRNIYDRKDIENYLKFCVNKGISVISLETDETLCMKSGFSFRPFTRLELYINIIRHIQTHASELALRNQGENRKHLIINNSGWEDMHIDLSK
jgi:hypothetical protein